MKKQIFKISILSILINTSPAFAFLEEDVDINSHHPIIRLQENPFLSQEIAEAANSFTQAISAGLKQKLMEDETTRTSFIFNNQFITKGVLFKKFPELKNLCEKNDEKDNDKIKLINQIIEQISERNKTCFAIIEKISQHAVISAKGDLRIARMNMSKNAKFLGTNIFISFYNILNENPEYSKVLENELAEIGQ